MRWLPLLLFVSIATASYAQVPEQNKHPLDDDPSVIVELGASTSWNTTGGAASFAPNFAAETTPIENWLELEAGISPFFTRNSTEWDTDLLFKKPWTLSRKAEFMLGVGPEWVYFRQKGTTSQSIAGEVAGDFMFWPNGRHRFGWYLEPVYDYNFMAGSIGMSAGFLIEPIGSISDVYSGFLALFDRYSEAQFWSDLALY